MQLCVFVCVRVCGLANIKHFARHVELEHVQWIPMLNSVDGKRGLREGLLEEMELHYTTLHNTTFRVRAKLSRRVSCGAVSWGATK